VCKVPFSFLWIKKKLIKKKKIFEKNHVPRRKKKKELKLHPIKKHEKNSQFFFTIARSEGKKKKESKNFQNFIFGFINIEG